MIIKNIEKRVKCKKIFQKNVNNTSLKVYKEINNPKTRIRFSMKNLSKDGNLINVPLFMVEYINKWIEMQKLGLSFRKVKKGKYAEVL